MIPIAEKTRSTPFEVIDQLRHLVEAPQSSESSLLPDVGVPRSEASFDFGDEIASHLLRANVGEGAESERDGGGVGVVHVAEGQGS